MARLLLRLAASSPLPSSSSATANSTSFSVAYETAQKVLGLFTKKDVSSPGQDLEDMQSTLYLVENARAWEGLGGKEGLGRSLKCVEAVVKTFQTFQDDQYDFHPYAIRKCNLNVYVDLVRWEASLHLDPMYVKAVISGSKILVRVYDDPALLEERARGDADAQTSAQSKKAKKKAAKKAHALAHQNNATPNLGTGQPPSNNEDKGIEPPTPKDDDPDGTKWLSTCSQDGEKKGELLDKAWGWLASIVHLLDEELVNGRVKADGSVDGGKRQLERAEERGVWGIVYDVCVRRGKWMLALKALHRLKALDADEEAHWRIVDLAVRATKTPPSAAIKSAFDSSLSSLLPSPSTIAVAEQHNTAYLQTGTNSSTAAKLLSWAKASWLLKEEGKDDIVRSLFELVKRMLDSGDVEMDPESALQIQTFLHYTLRLPEKAEEWRTECSKALEMSDIFEAAEKRAECMKWASSEVGMLYLEEEVERQEVVEEKE